MLSLIKYTEMYCCAAFYEFFFLCNPVQNHTFIFIVLLKCLIVIVQDDFNSSSFSYKPGPRLCLHCRFPEYNNPIGGTKAQALLALMS